MAKKIIKILLTGTLIVCLSILGTYLFRRLERELFATKHSTQLEDPSKILTNLSTLIELPTTTPTIARIKDTDLLNKKTNLFEEAEEGQYLIFYSDRVILFDNLQSKVVNVIYSKQQ